MDITRPGLLYVKTILFLLAGSLAAIGIFIDQPTLKTALLLAAAVWCFARAYYFAFYVMHRYVDPTFRFTGIISLASHLLTRPRKEKLAAGESRQ